MSYVIPTIITRTLERHGMVAIDKAELEALRNPPSQRDCPYPLFDDFFGGRSHREFLGMIAETEGKALSGLSVVRCAACGHVDFEIPVAYS